MAPPAVKSSCRIIAETYSTQHARRNSTGIFQPSEEKKGRQFHSVVWKPRFITRTTTVGVWFMFIIRRCPLKRRLEPNESIGVHVSLRSDPAL